MSSVSEIIILVMLEYCLFFIVLGKRSKEDEKLRESHLQNNCLEPSYVITVSD